MSSRARLSAPKSKRSRTRQWGDARQGACNQGQSEVPRSQDQGNLVRPGSHGDLPKARQNAGERIDKHLL
jgi:hypothetical protein